MKKLILCFLLMLFSFQGYCSTACFIAKENGKIIQEVGDCKTRYAPQSTFKIPLSLMGYDTGILKDETHPQWPFEVGYEAFVNVCKGAHNPKTWMRDSCVWYSQVLTQKLGVEKFKNYVERFQYGNQNVSGDPGKNNSLTESWLSSSLEISPQEQIAFLQKFLDKKLAVSTRADEMTKKILFREELPGGWKLYGKTGNGRMKNNFQQGWFVGWIEKGGRSIIFANHIVDDKEQDSFASFRARDQAKEKLWQIIDKIAEE